MVFHQRLRHYHGWLTNLVVPEEVRVSSTRGRESGRGGYRSPEATGISRLIPSIEALLSLATLIPRLWVMSV